MLRDDPNLFIDFWSSTRCLWNKLLANANQLLCRKYQRRFFFEEVTFDHVPGKEKDQVSPMFISEHQRKTSVCRFCKITQFFFFFVISKVCWTVCVFRFLNLESLKRIYASLFISRDFRHRCAMILKVERNIKTHKNRQKELYNVRMQFSPTCCQKCEHQCSNNDLLPA